MAHQALPSLAQTPVVTVDGTGTGLAFEGVGAVSAGAASRLLIDYPEPYRSQILDYLFKPNYGASIQHLKVELGGDMDSTDGAEPSHMHSATDLNFNRGYEWWLMQQAKLRNPNITFGALEWGVPGWIGNGQFYSQDNINYIINFIQGAQSTYGITISDIGIWNEVPANTNWVISLKQALLAAGLNTLVVAADQDNLDIVTQMTNYPPLVDAVDVVSIHYPEDPAPVYIPGGKRLWATEAGPWRGDWTGAQALARDFIQYYGGRITRTLIWSLISSYYDFLPIPGSGLMYGNTPWSGNYNVQPAIWATAHTTQFAQPGWQYIDSACGSLNGGSFATLKNGRDYSIIIETSSAPANQSVTFNVTGGLSTGAVHVWKSDVDNQFIQQGDITPVNGSFTINLSPGSIYSLTTTTGQSKGNATPPQSTAFPFPYFDNFEAYNLDQEPKYFSAIDGSFEIAACGGGRSGQCLRQAASGTPILWPEAGAPEPASVIGSTSWTDYQVTSDVFLEIPGEAKLIGRLTQENENTGDVSGYQFYASSAGTWELCLNNSNILAAGTVSFPIQTWHTMSLLLSGTQIQGVIDGVTVANVNNNAYSSGMAGLGVKDWTAAQFDNFRIAFPPGGTQIIPQSQMTATATSEMAGFEASKAVDGDDSTFWQTAFTCVGGCQPLMELPQSITISLGGSYNVTALYYLPRQDGSTNGMITAYNIYVSSDGTNFTLVSSGNWLIDPSQKSINLSSVSASYIRLEATAAVGGYVSASEITLKDALTVTAQNPVPTIGSVSPTAATAGGASFTLAASGNNFLNGSIVRWNGADRPTTFVNSTSLTAGISSSDLANAGSATVTVYNPSPGGGTSNAQAFTINPTSTVSSGPAQPSIPFLTGYGLNNPSLRNDFSGLVGMQFTVGQSPLYVTSLGRICIANNAQTHLLKLVNVATGLDVTGGSISLNMAACTRSEFIYGSLPATLTLAAGASYYLVSAELAGGDQWYDSGQISATSDAGVSNAVYFWNGSWYLHGAQNTSYTPPNFQYSLTASQNSIAPAPLFLPTGGTYTSAQSVSLSDGAAGTTIYYTTDGTSPNTNSAVYSSPISLSFTTLIQAFAVAPGLASSAVSAATYTIQSAATSTPTFSIAGGIYTSPQTVSLSDSTSGATIHYTTDGTAPTPNSAVYSAPISISVTTTTVNAVATAPGYASSPVSTATYSIQTQSSGGLSFVTGLVSSQPKPRSDFGGWVGMKLTIGATPLFVNSLGRICVAGNSSVHTVKFVDAASGADVSGASSQVSMANCTGGQFVYNTVFTPITLKPGGVYYLVSQETAAGDQWYDFGPISTSGDAFVNNSVYSYQGNWYPINGANTSYVPPNFQYSLSQGQAATAAVAPSFSPPAGTFTAPAKVTIASSTSGAVVYYTLDGSAPNLASAVYSAQITVSTTTTINAMAAAPGFGNSAAASATFTINTQPSQTPAPTFTPPPGTYSSAQSVVLTDPGATIYYTTDGSSPNSGSAIYTNPIPVSSTTVVNAAASSPGLAGSTPVSATYTIQLQQTQTPAPAFVPPAGAYTAAQSVTLSDPGATIYYTTDQSMPTTGSAVYNRPIPVNSTTTINAIAIASGMSQSTEASATYTISSVQNGTSFVTAYALSGQALRADFTGWVGMKVTTGSNSLNVTSLGRLCVAGNTGTHTIELVAAGSGAVVAGGSAQVVMSGCTPGQFVSSSLSTPITLAAGASYYLASQEAAGGDKWYDLGQISTTADASSNSSVYSSNGSNWIPINGPNTSYVPPTFGYQAAPPDPNPPFVTGFALSNPPLRHDFSGWVGMKLTVGSAPLNASFVGRICVAGNAAMHSVKFVDAVSGVDIAGGSGAVDMTGCTVGQFVYAALPNSITLASGQTYYLVSQEVNGGDQWYDFGSISVRSAAAVNSAVYGFGGGWYMIGGPNMSYVPPNFK